MPETDEETLLVEHLPDGKDDKQRKISKHGGSYHISIATRILQNLKNIKREDVADYFNTALFTLELRKENGKKVIVIEESKENKK